MSKTTPCGTPYAVNSAIYYDHIYSDHCKICKRERTYKKIKPIYIGESVITPCGRKYLARSPKNYYRHIYNAKCRSCKEMLEIPRRRSIKSLKPMRNDIRQKRFEASKSVRDSIHYQKRKLALTVEDDEKMEIEHIRPSSSLRTIEEQKGFLFEPPSSLRAIVPSNGFLFEPPPNFNFRCLRSSVHPFDLKQRIFFEYIERIGDNIVIPTIDDYKVIIACSVKTSYLEIVNNLSMIRKSADLHAKVRFEVLELINLLHRHIYMQKELSI